MVLRTRAAMNLRIVSDITEITLADVLKENNLRDQLRNQMLDTWATYDSSQRYLLTLAAYGFAYKQGARGTRFKAEGNESKFNSAVAQVVWLKRNSLSASQFGCDD